MQSLTNGIDAMIDILVIIKEFLLLQKTLLLAFKRQFSDAKDWDNLLDFPRHGAVQVNNEEWSFNQHGAGLMFISPNGLVVDVHDMVDDFEIVDPWRMEQFIESKHSNKNFEKYSELNELMQKLSLDRKLKSIGNDKYKLIT